MPRSQRISAFASLLLCLSSLAALAQTPAPRLRGSLQEGARAAVPGSRPDLTFQGEDLGPLPSNEPLRGLTLVFNRSVTQQADLDQLLAAQQDPASPQFHRWLSPESFGQRFGMAQADLDAASAWLREQGFTVTSTARARDRITFSGTAAQVEQAFGPSLHRFRGADAALHIAPTAPVLLPAGLASVTSAVLHLSTARPVALSHITPHPAYTAGSTGAHYLTPADLAVMYDLPVQLSDNNVNVGAGQSIAIAGQSYIDLSGTSAVQSFLSGTHVRNFSPVLIPGTGNKAISPPDSLESEIDVEYAGGVAPYVSVFLVYVGSDPSFNVFDSLAFAIDQNVAPVVSVSYGICETLLSSAEINGYDSLFQQGAAQGQTLIASSGDTGSLACAPYTPFGQFTAAQQAALSVNYPASSPWFTAVGGTQMADSSFAPSNTSGWRVTSPGSYDTFSSLLSWLPEVAWNESSAFNGLFAGSGGASSREPRPSWQTGVPGLPAGSSRVLPDVSFQASSAHPGFLFCSSIRQYGNGYCPYNTYMGPTYPTVGGTSLAAPTFAAIVAALNQDTNSLGQGSVNPTLYRLAANPSTSSAVFHDITSGTTACSSGISLCSSAGQTTYAAGTGFDLATGLGSLDYLNLRSAWPTAGSSTRATSISLQPFYSTPSAGSSDTINVQVLASSFPTGSVILTLDGVQVGTAPLTPEPFGTSSSATYNLTVPSATGSHLFAAIYPGDATHSPSRALLALAVGDSLATGTVTLSAPAVTLPANSTVNATIGIVPGGGYSGRLTWSLSLSNPSGDSTRALCYSIDSPAVQTATSATLLLGSGTACSSASSHTAQPQILSPGSPSRSPLASLSGATIASAVLLGLLPFARGRRPLPLLVLAIAAMLPLALAGCGGGVSPSGGSPSAAATPSVTYTATLSARDSVSGFVSTSTTFTLTVQ